MTWAIDTSIAKKSNNANLYENGYTVKIETKYLGLHPIPSKWSRIRSISL